MVTIIAFREDSWFVPETEFQLFSHLCNAYGAQVQMIRNWSEAVLPAGVPVIVCDQTGTEESKAYAHPASAVYVFGRTGMAASDLIAWAQPSIVLRIDTPQPVTLWGVQVASMIFRDRERLGV